MQRRQLFATAAALALGLTSRLVAAQPRHDERGPGGAPGSRPPPPGPAPAPRAAPPAGRGPAQPPAPPPRHVPAPSSRPMTPAHGRVPHRGPGAGLDRRYFRGDRLPADQRRRQYVVNDWRRHRLSAPPRGHHWVQSGADYLLVAIATGIITQIALGR